MVAGIVVAQQRPANPLPAFVRMDMPGIFLKSADQMASGAVTAVRMHMLKHQLFLGVCKTGAQPRKAAEKHRRRAE